MAKFVQEAKRVNPNTLPVCCRNHNIIVVIKFILSIVSAKFAIELQEATVGKNQNVWFQYIK